VSQAAETAPQRLTSLSTVRQFSKAISEKDLDQACGLLDESLVVHEAGGLPYSGEYLGPQGFRELLEKINERMELTPGPITQEPLTDETVVSRFRLTFTARHSGESVAMDLVELYQVRGGLIVELDVYYKDPSAVASLLARSGF
jgi:ketosteroid isomerase-like protein